MTHLKSQLIVLLTLLVLMPGAAMANLSKLPLEAIAVLRQVLQGKQMVPADELFEIVENGSRAHGPAEAVLTTMRRLGFFQLINSRPSRERDRVVAMVAARILKPQSKLTTTRWWLSTTLAEQLESYGIPKIITQTPSCTLRLVQVDRGVARVIARG